MGQEETTKPKVVLIGENGNALIIIGKCIKALKKAGMKDEAAEFQKEAMSGDYDHVLQTAMKFCEVE